MDKILEKKKILVVDDEPTNRLIVESYLKNDFQIIAVTNGKEALATLNETEIDLILLDIMMPEISGIEVCEKVRVKEKNNDIPIIFLTAKNDVEDIVKGLEVGGNDYLTKPFRPLELKARVYSQLKLKEAKEIALEHENLKNIKSLMVRLNHEIRNSLTVVAAGMMSLKQSDNSDTVAAMSDAIQKISNLLSKIEKLDKIKHTTYINETEMLDLDGDKKD